MADLNCGRMRSRPRANPRLYLGNEREPRHATHWTIDLLCGIAERRDARTVQPAGNLEWLPVLRRLAAVVVIGVSLLSAAFPAFACSMDASKSDCCGQGGAPSFCTSGERFMPPSDVTASMCCASGQAAFPDVAIGSGRTSHERGHYPSSPDPVALIAWSASWSVPASTPRVTPSLIRSPPGTAALTYLHTARLRL